ncbi:unnamed protein product, partial [Mesorhabditis belari]|uniref:MIF4G domain-containing protein n=1 Tax=Mesorhabditis belari TaxID=2138241 RepID=A0AAF3J7E6_9BILA
MPSFLRTTLLGAQRLFVHQSPFLVANIIFSALKRAKKKIVHFSGLSRKKKRSFFSKKRRKMEKENPITVSDGANDQKSRVSSKKPASRPAMQIYRPPGLRSGVTGSPPDSQSENGTGISLVVKSQNQAPPTGETAGSKPSPTANHKNYNRYEENNNHRKSPPRSGLNQGEQRLNRTESSLSSESAISQKSSGGASFGSVSGEIEKLKTTLEKQNKSQRPTPPKSMPIQKEKQRKLLSPKDLFDISTALRSLQIPTNIAELEQLIASEYRDEMAAECVGNSIAQHSIEGGTRCCKQSTKICGLLADTLCFPGLIKGLHSSIAQYFDCRERLRQEHFRMWIAFLNFVSDIYANVGCTPNGDFASVVFQVFDFLLRPPILENLKIEELECLIACLLSIGYDLERDCPDRLSHLKDLIRDAFIEVHEPWARKMILLLLELGASGWKLPPEANDYYFLQSNN